MINDIIENLFEDVMPFDPERFLSRLKSVVMLANRPGTEGEKAAAMDALRRMQDTARENTVKMPKGTGEAFLARMRAIIDGVGKEEPASSYRPRPRPSPVVFKVGDWIYNTDFRKAAKITEVIIRGSNNFYEIDWNGNGKHMWWNDVDVRKATQDEIDSALASRTYSSSSKTTFKKGDWIFNTKSQETGRITLVSASGERFIVEIKDRKDNTTTTTWKIDDIRKASKEEIEKASKTTHDRNNSSQFKVGDWVVYKDPVRKKEMTGQITRIETLRSAIVSFGPFKVECPFDKLRLATAEEIRKETEPKASSSSSSSGRWKIIGMGRYQDEKSNKVYGWAKKSDTYVTFWGRYAGPYTAKQHSKYEAEEIYDKKTSGKYIPFDWESNRYYHMAKSNLDDALAKLGL